MGGSIKCVIHQGLVLAGSDEQGILFFAIEGTAHLRAGGGRREKVEMLDSGGSSFSDCSKTTNIVKKPKGEVILSTPLSCKSWMDK
jgi:hypothetical protein